MATDLIESDAVLKAGSDMNSNNRSSDLVSPQRTDGGPGHRQTSSPSSSGVSAEGDEEELDELQSSTASTVENGEEAFQEESLSKTSGTEHDYEEEARTSSPVSLPQPRAPPGPMGRCVYLAYYLQFTCHHQIVARVYFGQYSKGVIGS